MRNHDLSAVEWATGEVVDAGYTSDIYNIGGQKIRKFNIGSGTFTTNASGQITVPHGLGQTPSQVLCSPGGTGTNNRISAVSTFSSTNFVVQYRNGADNVILGSGVPISVYFLAIAE